MPVHDVSFEIPQKLALSKDVTFEIKSDGVKLGTLLISKGNLEWVPAGNKVNKCRLTWERFADVMAEAGSIQRIKN